ncbi:MAG TPA: hypothetical protein VEM57_09455 [Candidatus Binatus sp.]|nr:hypothetical protein [Candidatus Binatus sp.]
MAVAVSPRAEAAPLTRAERKLAWLLRLFAVLFAIGAVGFLVRPDETVTDLDRLGALVGLPTLQRTAVAGVSDFWLPLAIANMATIAACAWLAAGDVRRRRALVYPIVVSKLASSATGVLLFVRWSPAFPFLAVALVDLPIAVILVSALRAAPAER